MGRKAGRVTKLVATTWLGAVGGFVGPQFVTWVLSTFCTALAGSIAHARAAAITWIGGTLIGGPITMFALGIPFALFFAFKAFAKVNAAQNAYKEKVEATLNQEIQITVNDQTKTLKKWQHFAALLAEINDLKKDIENARESIKTSLGATMLTQSPRLKSFSTEIAAASITVPLVVTQYSSYLCRLSTHFAV